jgi:hypothetical protein
MVLYLGDLANPKNGLTLVHVKQNKKCEGIEVAYSIKEKIR